MAEKLHIGPYTGVVVAEYREPNFLAQLEDLPAHLADPVASGPFARARVLRTPLQRNGETVPVAVKVFGAQGAVRSRLARNRGSKAERSWGIASALWDKGVGTPRPIGFLEHWTGSRLGESYFLAEFADGMSDFHTELLHVWHEEFQLGKFLDLMDPVALAVRAMHDAGIQHGDLGNQNILLRRLDDGAWGDVQFIDVNRGRSRPEGLTLRERAFDLSRLTLPPRLMMYFRRMYDRERFFRNEELPRELVKWERRYRRRFGFHTWTRPLRHPIKYWRNRRRKRGALDYPKPKERWIWDERSDQAIATMTHRERARYRSVGTALKQASTSLIQGPPAMARYKKARHEVYTRPVELAGRIAMTIHPRPETAARERELIEGLGKVPLLVRYYRHEKPEDRAFTTRFVRELHETGYPVALALIQDPKAVADTSVWRAFLEEVLADVGDIAQWVEVGHATNRVKWGIWGHGDYRRLLQEFVALRPKYPHLKLMGPAINDFEYYCVAASLQSLPRDLRFDAMSLHLYVDRRGAPENRQHNFSSVDKFVLARVLARQSKHCADEVIISEVNWFLLDEGKYAHPFAPYAPVDAAHEWDIDEERYADYMLRYYLHALCSGMVDRVYWWRLANGAFGLVDDTGPEWRIRPAYRALAAFLDRYRDATFTERIDVGDDNAYLLRLRRANGTDDVVAFRHGGARVVDLPFSYEGVLDRTGDPLPAPAEIGGRVVYFTGVS